MGQDKHKSLLNVLDLESVHIKIIYVDNNLQEEGFNSQFICYNYNTMTHKLKSNFRMKTSWTTLIYIFNLKPQISTLSSIIHDLCKTFSQQMVAIIVTSITYSWNMDDIMMIDLWWKWHDVLYRKDDKKTSHCIELIKSKKYIQSNKDLLWWFQIKPAQIFLKIMKIKLFHLTPSTFTLN